MNNHPILFDTEMVGAVLDGRKTQMRRVIKPQPILLPDGWKWKNTIFHTHGLSEILNASCKEGNTRWAQEPWRVCGWWPGEPLLIEYKDGVIRECDSAMPCEETRYAEWEELMWIQSTDDCKKAGMVAVEDEAFYWSDGVERDIPTRWRASIYMPRWVSRLALNVVAVRAERLQAISETDAQQSGIDKMLNSNYWKHCCYAGAYCYGTSSAKSSFSKLWDSINARRGFSWHSNPWVWVIEFKVL